MYCVNCGAEIPDNAKFCERCGKPTPNNPAASENTPTQQAAQYTAPQQTGKPIPPQSQDQPIQTGTTTPPQQQTQKGGSKALIVIAVVVGVAAVILLAVLLVGMLGGGSGGTSATPSSSSSSSASKPAGSSSAASSSASASTSKSTSSTSSGATQSGMQTIGNRSTGTMQVPSNWIDETSTLDPNIVDSTDMVYYADPSSEYTSSAFSHFMFSRAVQMRVYPTSYTDIAQQALTEYNGNPIYSAPDSMETTYNGHSCYLITTTVQEDGLAIGDLVIDRDGDGRAAMRMTFFGTPSTIEDVLGYASTWQPS